jgi:hypothetical protein
MYNLKSYIIMKKFIGLTMALAFGFFLVSVEAQRQQDPRIPQDQQEGQQQEQYQHQQQAQHRVPVEKNDLPDEVVETIENEFEDWNFQQAFRVSGGMEGAEGIEQREGAAERADEEFYMIQLEKDGEFKTVHISEDGEKLDHKDKDKDQQRKRQRN